MKNKKFLRLTIVLALAVVAGVLLTSHIADRAPFANVSAITPSTTIKLPAPTPILPVKYVITEPTKYVPSTPLSKCKAGTWSCKGWSVCSSSGKQTRTCTLSNDCADAPTPAKPTEAQSCTPPPVVPTPILVPVPAPAPKVTCSSQKPVCGDWSDCVAKTNGNGSQNRSCETKTVCSDGSSKSAKGSETQACTPPPVVPTPPSTQTPVEPTAPTAQTPPAAPTPAPAPTSVVVPVAVTCGNPVDSCGEWSACNSTDSNGKGTQSRSCTATSSCSDGSVKSSGRKDNQDCTVPVATTSPSNTPDISTLPIALQQETKQDISSFQNSIGETAFHDLVAASNSDNSPTTVPQTAPAAVVSVDQGLVHNEQITAVAQEKYDLKIESGAQQTVQDGTSDTLKVLYGIDPTKSSATENSANAADKIFNGGAVVEQTIASGGTVPTVIGNMHDGEKIPSKDFTFTGAAPAGTKLEVLAVDEKGHTISLGTTESLPNNRFIFTQDKNIKKGNYLMYVKSSDGAYKSKAVLLKVDDKAALKAPEPQKLSTEAITKEILSRKLTLKINDRIPVLSGVTELGTVIVGNWTSALFTSALIADVSGGEFKTSAPNPLEPGNHQVTIYAKRPEEAKMSSSVLVKFTVTESGQLENVTTEAGPGSVQTARGSAAESQKLPIVPIAAGVGIVAVLVGIAVFRKKKLV